MACACNKCFQLVEGNIAAAFGFYGKFVARNPWKVLIIAIVINCCLSVGMIKLNKVTGVEKVYTPMDSQASKDTDTLESIFPDLSGSNFRGYQMPDVGKYGQVIVRPNSGDVMDTSFLTSLGQLYTFLTQISTTNDNGTTVSYTDICGIRDGSCAVDGDLFVDSEFSAAVTSSSVDYPLFSHSTKGHIYYEQQVAGAKVVSGKLQSATMVTLTLHLRTDTSYYVAMADKWQDVFLSKVEAYSHPDFQISYTHADSLSEELSNNVSGDIGLFSVTFTLMITYACVATLTARCDSVGQRALLGFAGVLPAGLAIVSAFGICSACGVEFVSIVGVIPFLIIGIGVDDMFLLMSGITESNYDDDIVTRIGETMATSGVSITITSLTDLLAFAAGASSVFLGVRNFCIYAGVAVVFCYLNQATMFIACIVINERRTKSNRHFASCRKLGSRTGNDDVIEVNIVRLENGVIELKSAENKAISDSEISIHNEKDAVKNTENGLPEGATNTDFSKTESEESKTAVRPLSPKPRQNETESRSKTSPQPQPSCKQYCSYLCCTGRPPRSQAESESHLDRFPRWLIPKLLDPSWAKALILVIFAGYLGVSIYGITEMKQGLDVKNLVSDDSYVYKFQEALEEFPGDTIVSFVFDSELTYSDSNSKTAIDNFIAAVKSDSMVRDDFEINWFSSFDPYAVKSSEAAFIASLQTYLSAPSSSRFENDVVIDTTNNVIKQSRIHLISETLADSQEQGKFMLRMRELADGSSLSVFAFSPAFLYYEQYVAILPQTLQTVGIAIVMVFFVTCLFMPHPLLLLYITITVTMITVGIFGFLDFVGLTLSSITMVHIIMSIGFSVDFAAHICHGYMISDGKDRHERMINGIKRSGAPIFHGAMSSLLGVIILGAANSYIFFSFFKVMTIVVSFGILHALFLLPVILSLIGPAISDESQPILSKNNEHSSHGSRATSVKSRTSPQVSPEHCVLGTYDISAKSQAGPQECLVHSIPGTCAISAKSQTSPQDKKENNAPGTRATPEQLPTSLQDNKDHSEPGTNATSEKSQTRPQDKENSAPGTNATSAKSQTSPHDNKEHSAPGTNATSEKSQTSSQDKEENSAPGTNATSAKSQTGLQDKENSAPGTNVTSEKSQTSLQDKENSAPGTNVTSEKSQTSLQDKENSVPGKSAKSAKSQTSPHDNKEHSAPGTNATSEKSQTSSQDKDENSAPGTNATSAKSQTSLQDKENSAPGTNVTSEKSQTSLQDKENSAPGTNVTSEKSQTSLQDKENSAPGKSAKSAKSQTSPHDNKEHSAPGTNAISEKSQTSSQDKDENSAPGTNATSAKSQTGLQDKKDHIAPGKNVKSEKSHTGLQDKKDHIAPGKNVKSEKSHTSRQDKKDNIAPVKRGKPAKWQTNPQDKKENKAPVKSATSGKSQTSPPDKRENNAPGKRAQPAKSQTRPQDKKRT